MGSNMKSFYEHLTEASGQGGYDFEDKVNGHLKKHGLQDKNQKSAGASAEAPDGTLHASGKHHNLEIKKDSKAMMGQIGMHHDGKSWTVKASSTIMAKTERLLTFKLVSLVCIIQIKIMAKLAPRR